jgi:hypothetical protein
MKAINAQQSVGHSRSFAKIPLSSFPYLKGEPQPVGTVDLGFGIPFAAFANTSGLIYGLETTGKSSPGPVRIRRGLRRKTENPTTMPQMWEDRYATLPSAALGKTFVHVYSAVPLSRVWHSILEDTFCSAREMTKIGILPISRFADRAYLA